MATLNWFQSGAVFSRDSVARDGTTSVAANVPVCSDVLSVAPAAYTTVTADGSSGETVLPHSRTNDYLLGLGSSTGYFYVMPTTGNEWYLMSNETAFTFVWGLKSGTVLASSGALGSIKLWRGVYDTNAEQWTFSEVIGSSSDLQFSTNGYPAQWSVADEGASSENHVMCVEYGSAANTSWRYGRRAFLSHDDGQTWEVVIDQDNAEQVPLEFTHFHAVAYHSGTGNFVVTCGDTTYLRRAYTVTRAGVATEFLHPDETFIQPTWLLDTGHATKLYFGGDENLQVGALDVVTGDYYPVWDGWNHWPLQSYCWLMWQHEGLYYAAQMDNTVDSASFLSHRVTSIVVSRNPEGPWTKYATLPRGNGATTYGGCDGDGNLRIRLSTPTGFQSLKIPKAKTIKQTGVLVESAATNFSPTTIMDTVTSNGWYASSGSTVEIATGGGIDGTNCIKFTSKVDETFAASTLSYITKANVPTADKGKPYQVSMWVKPDYPLVLNAYATYWTGHTGDSVSFPCKANAWNKVVVPVHASVNEANCTAGFALLVVKENTNTARVLLVDKVQCEMAPSSSMVAYGGTRAVTRLGFTKTVASDWSDLFKFVPLYNSATFNSPKHSLLHGTKLYIRSYHQGTVSAQVYFDFGCAGALNGTPVYADSHSTIIASSSIFRASNEGNTLYIYTAAAGVKAYKILSVTDATTVVVDGNASTYTTGALVTVYDPRICMDVTDGSNTDLHYSTYSQLDGGGPVLISVKYGVVAGDGKFGLYTSNGTALTKATVSGEHSFTPGSTSLAVDCCYESNVNYPGYHVQHGFYGFKTATQISRLFGRKPQKMLLTYLDD